MINFILKNTSKWFDTLERSWETHRTERFVGSLLLVAFAFSLFVIELGRRDLLPAGIDRWIPESHFYAINTTFTLLLVIEVIGLIFGLARSVSDSVGKQFEILSLILLRQSFKELVNFGEPITWLKDYTPVLHILSGGGGALLIFLVLGVYYRIQKHRPLTEDALATRKFVEAKKLVSLSLLLIFCGIGFHNLWSFFVESRASSFFDKFYTILIFSDVLIILISLRYSSIYRVLFRNSGFALATVVIRLALTAPPYINASLGLGAVIFAVGLTFSYNIFENKNSTHQDGEFRTKKNRAK